MTRTMTLELDELDYEAIQEAMAYRQTWRVMPDDGGSNLAGRLLAEICRGWLVEVGPEEDFRHEQ